MKTVGTLGERGVIRVIDGIVKSEASVGIGDDCAAIDLGDRYLLVTTDMMVTKTHIPKGMGPYDIGWALVAVNLSDIAAMGGKPLGVVTAIGITKGHPIEFLEQMVDGMNDCALRFGTTTEVVGSAPIRAVPHWWLGFDFGKPFDKTMGQPAFRIACPSRFTRRSCAATFVFRQSSTTRPSFHMTRLSGSGRSSDIAMM